MRRGEGLCWDEEARDEALYTRGEGDEEQGTVEGGRSVGVFFLNQGMGTVLGKAMCGRSCV